MRREEPIDARALLREALTRVMGPLKGILQPAPLSEDLLVNPATVIELLDELADLQAKHAAALDELDRVKAKAVEAATSATLAVARLEQAREALRRVGHPDLQHRARCARYSVPQDVCDCGLGDLRAALAPGAGS